MRREIIAFVHLGNFLPRWLIPNALDHQARFENRVVVIVDDTKVARKLDKCGLETWLRRPSAILGGVYAGEENLLAIRRKFWQNTSDRFVALAEFHKENEGSLVQVETDNVLLNAFHELDFSSLSSQIAFPIGSRTLGLGSVVYFSDSEASSNMARAFMRIRAPKTNSTGVNDMTRLSDYFKQHDDKVLILPTGFESMSKEFFGDDEGLKILCTQNQSKFHGIFDAITIGQYITGQDPRNRKGFKLVGSHSSAFYPAQPAFRYSMIEDTLRATSLNGREDSPVLNLHVHSKDMNFFREETRIDALRAFIARGHIVPRLHFDSWGFRNHVSESVRSMPKRLGFKNTSKSVD